MSENNSKINETIENTVIPVTAAPVSLGILQVSSPAALVTGASEMAQELAKIINKQGLFTVIQGRQHVNVEGWTTLAVMLGCVAREVETVERDGVYVATVELVRMADGACISRASAECGSDDEKDRSGKPIWAGRPRYARRSMAQTRATSKACRLAFSWIMQLAGYAVTPAEEMIFAADNQPKPTQPQPRSSYTKSAQSSPKPTVSAEKKTVSLSDIQNIADTIEIYKLDKERVKAWALKAYKINDYAELSESQYNRLLDKLAQFALDAGVSPDDIAQKAKEFGESASSAMQSAQYAEGQDYYNEVAHAQKLSADASRYERLAKQMRKSLSQEVAIAA